MKRSVLTVMLLVMVFAIVGAAKPASAQPFYQFAYQFSRVTNDPGENFPLGFEVGAGIPLGMGPLKIIGDLTWARRSFGGDADEFDGSESALTFGAGARYVPVMMPRLGIQAIAGIQRSSFDLDCPSGFDEFCSDSQSDLFIQPGVQFTVRPINDSWDMFVGGNFRIVMSEGESGKILTLLFGLASK